MQTKIMIDLFEFYKVKDWIKVLGLVLIGYLASGSTSSIALFVHLLSASLAMAFARSINDYFDAKIHREKNYIFRFREKFGTAKTLLLCLLPLFVLVVVAGFYFFALSSMIFLMFYLILAYSYSAPPLRFRNRTFVELPMNVLMGISIFAFAFLFDATPNLLFYFFMLSVGWYFFVSESIHQIAHFNKDKIDGKITTAIKFGRQKFLKILKYSFAVVFSFVPIFIYSFKYSDLLVLPIIFILVNIVRLLKLLQVKSRFEMIRTKMYGIEEGVLYIVSLYVLFSL